MPVIIFVTFFWIIWDVGFSVWSAVVSGPLTTKEWIWLGSGLAFAVFALVAEWREWKARDRAEKAHNQETAKLNEKLAALQSYNEGAFTALGMQVRAGSSEPSLIVAAVQKRLEYLEEENRIKDDRIAELRSQWRHVTERQYEQLGRAFPEIVGLDDFRHGADALRIHIIYPWGDIEAANYAQQLSRLFGSCGIALLTTEGREYETLNSSGMALLVPDPETLTDREKQVAGLLKSAEINFRFLRPAAGNPDPAVAAWEQGKAVKVRVGRKR